MKRKLLALFMTGILAAGLVGCAGTSTDSSAADISSAESSGTKDAKTSSAASGGTDEDNALSFPLEESVTLTLWFPYGNTFWDNMKDNPVVGMVEKELNINLEFIHPPQSDQETSLQLLFASQDLPDIIRLDGGISPSLVYPGGGEKGVQDGVILQLNDLIDQYAPNYKAVRARGGDYEKDTITDNGVMWAMYTVGDVFEKPWGGLAYRKDWADDLGLDTPLTLDDWHTMLTEFKNEKGAVAPLMIPDTGLLVCSEFLSAFGVGKEFYHVNNEVKYGPLEEGMREYVELMRQWFTEGLIDPNFAANEEFMNSGNGWGLPTSYVIDGKTGAGFSSWAMTRNGISSLYKATDDTTIDYFAAPPPVKKEGDQTQIRMTTSTVYNPWIVTTSCENPEVAVMYMDWGYTEEGILILNYGDASNYTITEEGPRFNDDILYSTEYDLPTFLSAFTWETPPGMRDIERAYQNTDEDLLAARDVWMAAGSDNVIPIGVAFTSEESSEYATVMGDITTYAEEMIPQFINGRVTMDEWDGFVAQIKSMNIDRAIELKQAAFDRYRNREA